MFNVSIPLGSGPVVDPYTGPYKLSGKDNTGIWAGYLIRDNHPIGVIDSLLVTGTDVSFDGWKQLTFVGQNLSSTFNGFSIDVGSNPFIIGWTVTCANDAVYEQINPVPEFSTLLLLGSLIALGGIGRKKLLGKSTP